MPKNIRARMVRKREAMRRARAAESEEARASRMAKDRVRRRCSRAKETPEVRAARLEDARLRQRQRRKRVREEKERHVRDALCRALLEQVQHDCRDLAGCEDADLFLEELCGDYRETLGKTQQPPDAIMLFLNQNFLRQTRQQNRELQDIAMLGFNPEMCIEDVQQLLESQEDVPPDRPKCSTSRDREDPCSPHIKEEKEEFWPSQFERLEEADITSQHRVLRLHEIVSQRVCTSFCHADVQEHMESKEEVLEPPCIKEEPEELPTSQEGEQLQGLNNADIISFTYIPVSHEDNEEKPL